MGLLDLTSRVLTEYKADVADHKQAVRELKGEAQELAKAELEAAQARNEQFEDWIKGLAKISVSMLALKELGKIIFEGFNESVKESRLETAAYGVDLDRLGEAAHGLMSRMQLLEFAAKANHSAFKNSQADMETAEKAMLALERRGASAAEAQEAVTAALVTGRTRGLEPFGIVVDKHLDKLAALGDENLTLAQRTEIHQKALEQLKIVSGEVVDGQDAIGESMQRTEVSLSNSWAEVKKELGQLALAFQPLIAALADVLGYVSQIVDGGRRGREETAKQVGRANEAYAGVYDQAETIDLKLARLQRKIDYGMTGQAAPKDVFDYLDQLTKAGRDYYVNPDDIEIDPAKFDDSARKKAEEAAKKRAEEMAKLSDKIEKEYTDALLKQLTAEAPGLGALGALNVDRGEYGSVQRLNAFGSAANDNAGSIDTASLQRALGGSQAAGYEQWRAGQQSTFLTKTFGPLSDFDAYKEAFKALSGATTAALGAWIDGSMSAGQAFQKFVSEALKSLASQMLVESLKHAAYALGSLAFGDARGAALHGAAAAAFGAGALAAAEGAKLLGGSSPNVSRAASGAGGVGAPQNYGGGAANGNGQSSTVIVYGDSFADDSPRMRQIRAQKIIAQAGITSVGAAA